MSLIAIAIGLPWLIVTLFVVLGAWIGFQLIYQNGRLLSGLEALEARLAQLAVAPVAGPAAAAGARAERGACRRRTLPAGRWPARE